MSQENNSQKTATGEPKVIGKVRPKHKTPKVRVGKPPRVVTGAMRMKYAYGNSGSYGGWGTSSNTNLSSGGNFYSPELSTDFLELPQSIDERRNFYRFFYQNDPFVGQAIDIHTEVPLSKVRLGIAKVQDQKNRPIAEMALDFCSRWSKDVNLLQKLISIVHDYYLLGEVFVFAEDKSPDMPQEISHHLVRTLTEDGDLKEEWVKKPDGDERAVKWLKQNYKGWTNLKVIPPEQVRMESFALTDEKIFSFIPDSKTKNLFEQARQGDAESVRVLKSFPDEFVTSVLNGGNIYLNTDPNAGSFVHYLARKKSDYEPRGHSILERCLRTLIFIDKLRQAQTSIASRHMTPIRVITAEGADINDIEDLRDQVDYALQDPDYSIITNFEVRWEEMGSQNRLLDLHGEYDLANRQLYAGLGVTESLLSGESSYSGDKINLEVINTRYMLLREIMQDFVERHLLEPMCRRMGFVEEIDGVIHVLTPSLSFTRLALRDNQDTFDALFNLYQKGSLDVEVILELLNIDPIATKEKLERDAWTMNNSSFNEIYRGVFNDVGRALVESSNVVELLAEHLGLEYAPKEEEGQSRF